MILRNNNLTLDRLRTLMVFVYFQAYPNVQIFRYDLDMVSELTNPSCLSKTPNTYLLMHVLPHILDFIPQDPYMRGDIEK